MIGDGNHGGVEPQIAVSPKDPRNIAVVATSIQYDILTPENLKDFGLEVQQDPQSGQYTVGLSSAAHPYIKYSDALNAQTELSQAVNQALQISRAMQLIQSPAGAGPAPEPAPPTPPVTPADGGPLGLAEVGLEAGQ